MNEAELIQLITRQLMAAMNAGQTPAPAQTSPSSAASTSPVLSKSSPAPIHPPIGVCTGDYSKFEELRGKLTIAPAVASPVPPVAAAASGSAKVSAAPAPAHNPTPKPAASTSGVASGVTSGVGVAPVLSGMVTEKMLKAAGSQVIQLAARAKLTPLALDYVKHNQLKLMTVSDPLRPASSGAAASATAAAAPWLAWIEGACPASARVVGQFSGKLAMLQGAADMVEAIHELDERVKAGAITGGVLFVRSAAKALCYANRCTSLRAALGHCLGAVRLAVDSLAANVLVLEYPFQPYYPMLGMARLFLAAPRPSTQAIEQELARLSHCACHKEAGA